MVVKSHAILAVGWIASILPPVFLQQSVKQAQAQESSPPAATQPLMTTSPEARDWPADPWPALGEAQWLAALHEVRAEAQRRSDAANLPGGDDVLETSRFIMHTDVPRPQAARLMLLLEKACDALERILPTPPAQQPQRQPGDDQRGFQPRFYGKCVVMLFDQHDAFVKAQADVFNQLVPLGLVGICHPDGPQTYVAAHRCQDDSLLEWTLVHETVHAWMHRWITPKRLPPWANDGIADYIADQVVRNSHVGRERRQNALAFIRGGGNLAGVLDLTYADADWPGPKDVGPALGALVVELMIREQPAAFARWARSVKHGRDWREALQDELGVPPEHLAQTASHFFRVND